VRTATDLLRASIWARTLTEADLGRLAAELIERVVPANGSVCRKGEPVEH